MARILDIGITAWSPLAGGVITGKYSQDTDVEKRTKTSKPNSNNEPKRNSPDNPVNAIFLNERNISIADEVSKIARVNSQFSCYYLVFIILYRSNVFP